MTTRDGTRAITVPRARLRDQDGPPTEFRSTVLPRYARRTREVDEALLGCYFGGVNSRRIRGLSGRCWARRTCRRAPFRAW